MERRAFIFDWAVVKDMTAYERAARLAPLSYRRRIVMCTPDERVEMEAALKEFGTNPEKAVLLYRKLRSATDDLPVEEYNAEVRRILPDNAGQYQHLLAND